MVLVSKSDESVRFCVDYCRLNAMTKMNEFPLPRVDDCLDMLSGMKYFSILDLASGYWQVAMSPESKEKIALITHEGLYKFTLRLVQCSCNFPEVDGKGVITKKCMVYLDEILVMEPTFQEHLDNLREVLERLSQAGLRIQPKKCQLAQQKVVYLG